MLYLISDIHGDVISFKKMLKKISFDSATDQMIVMGDIFDWNDEGIPLLEFMSDYLVDGSMQLIKGNHELFAQMYIEGSMSERQWIIFGGGGTVRDIKRLNVDGQMKLTGILHICHIILRSSRRSTEIVLLLIQVFIAAHTSEMLTGPSISLSLL